MKKFLNTIRDFMSNEDFHNPVTDKEKALFSRKEKLKGRVLPLAVLGALALGATAITFAVTGIGFVAAFAAGVPLYMSAVMEARMRLAVRALKKDDETKSYDLNDAAGIANFNKDFPEQPDFAKAYSNLAQKMGFSTAPLIYAKPGYDAYTTKNSLLPSGKPHVVLGRGVLRRQGHAQLLGTVAHELAHVQKKHVPRGLLPGTLTGVAQTFAAAGSAGILAASGLTVMIVGSVVATLGVFALGTAMRAKIAQYDEREADRVALVETGMPESDIGLGTGARFERAPKGLSERFMKALHGLKNQHPFSHTRSKYAEEFAKRNPDYCKEKRAGYDKTAAVSVPVPAPA